jgi:hypothetical protein
VTVGLCSEIMGPCSETVGPCRETVVPCSETVGPCRETVVPCSETVGPCRETVVPCSETVGPCSETVSPCSETVDPCSELVGPCSETGGPCSDNLWVREATPCVYAMPSWVHAMIHGPMQRRDGFFIVVCIVIPTLYAAISKYRPQVGVMYAEPIFLNVYGARESIPRNEFRQPM